MESLEGTVTGGRQGFIVTLKLQGGTHESTQFHSPRELPSTKFTPVPLEPAHKHSKFCLKCDDDTGRCAF